MAQAGLVVLPLLEVPGEAPEDFAVRSVGEIEEIPEVEAFGVGFAVGEISFGDWRNRYLVGRLHLD